MSEHVNAAVPVSGAESKRRYIDILGTQYEIQFDVPANEMPEEADGCIDVTTHTIKIAMLEPDRDSVQDMNAYGRKVLRHEITHAFFYESGIWNCSSTVETWGMDETLTDWIAIQSPKLFKVFQELGCL